MIVTSENNSPNKNPLNKLNNPDFYDNQTDQQQNNQNNNFRNLNKNQQSANFPGSTRSASLQIDQKFEALDKQLKNFDQMYQNKRKNYEILFEACDSSAKQQKIQENNNLSPKEFQSPAKVYFFMPTQYNSQKEYNQLQKNNKRNHFYSQDQLAVVSQTNQHNKLQQQQKNYSQNELLQQQQQQDILFLEDKQKIQNQQELERFQEIESLPQYSNRENGLDQSLDVIKNQKQQLQQQQQQKQLHYQYSLQKHQKNLSITNNKNINNTTSNNQQILKEKSILQQNLNQNKNNNTKPLIQELSLKQQQINSKLQQNAQINKNTKLNEIIGQKLFNSKNSLQTDTFKSNAYYDLYNQKHGGLYTSVNNNNSNKIQDFLSNFVSQRNENRQKNRSKSNENQEEYLEKKQLKQEIQKNQNNKENINDPNIQLIKDQQKDKYNKLKAQYNQIYKENYVLNNDFKNIEQKYTQTLEKLNQLQRKEIKSQKEKSELETENNILQDQIKIFQQNFNEQCEQIGIQEEKNQYLNQQNKDQLLKINQLETQIDKYQKQEQEQTRLNNQNYQDLKSENQSLKNYCKQYEQQLIGLEEKLGKTKDFHDKIQKLNLKIQNQDEVIEILKAKNYKYQNSNNEMNAKDQIQYEKLKYNKLSEEYNRLKQENNELALTVQILQKQVKQSKIKLQNQNQKLEGFNTFKSVDQATLDKYNNTNNQYQDQQLFNNQYYQLQKQFQHQQQLQQYQNIQNIDKQSPYMDFQQEIYKQDQIIETLNEEQEQLKQQYFSVNQPNHQEQYQQNNNFDQNQQQHMSILSNANSNANDINNNNNLFLNSKLEQLTPILCKDNKGDLPSDRRFNNEKVQIKQFKASPSFLINNAYKTSNNLKQRQQIGGNHKRHLTFQAETNSSNQFNTINNQQSNNQLQNINFFSNQDQNDQPKQFIKNFSTNFQSNFGQKYSDTNPSTNRGECSSRDINDMYKRYNNLQRKTSLI